MALSFLLKQYVSQNTHPVVTLKPFIVDHKAREGSADEAYRVAGWLKDLGLDPSILTLPWPHGVDPSSLSDFETIARRLRYQCIGKACAEQRIRSLLLGHHQDDNVETVLSRLVRRQRQSTGLEGVSCVGNIPECHGIFGIAESGLFTQLRGYPSTDNFTEHLKPKDHKEGLKLKTNNTHLRKDLSILVAEGGISIFRPLLSFPKPRLMATCLQNNIPFTTDKTNFDPTVTSRNTLRYLLSNDMLPRALQAPSMLRFIERSKRVSADMKQESDVFMKKLKIHKLDLPSGSLIVEFPHPNAIGDFGTDKEVTTDRAIAKLRNIEAITLRRILDIVSPAPKNNTPLHKFELALHTIFPTSQSHVEKLQKQDTFTLGGVKFRPASLPYGDLTQLSLKDIQPRVQCNLVMGDSSGRNIWFLTRTPFANDLPKSATNFDLELPALHDGCFSATPSWSSWQLWDNRYWIRVKAEKAHAALLEEKNSSKYTGTVIPLVVRSLETDDLGDIRRQLKESAPANASAPRAHFIDKLYYFNSLLKDRAPGYIRHTIPVIAEATGQKRVLAFPSFARRLPITLTRTIHDSIVEDHWLVQSQIAFKNVDIELLQSLYQQSGNTLLTHRVQFGT
ncbi:hypothetical protein AJ79_03251 [Helicocarpus griseus UAMH5409]|uniref:tRNA(Ile)-lysidine synthetase n=1 Tax=Helicocarpus griseus UAMH5409 TaxID=1447875 RepID=A0A2B7XQU4_9EURO|nr:hypothetical protein AJ79_03251 [Helicocarpus griseus UAMH5409]